MRLISTAYADGESMPVRFAAPPVPGGLDISPPLNWSDGPPSTRSFALAMIDRHPVARDWVHWLVLSIPAGAAELSEGASGHSMPPGAIELEGTSGTTGYAGPRPPRGTGPHAYEVVVYALDAESLSVPRRPSAAQFEGALGAHVLERASLTGYFEQP